MKKLKFLISEYFGFPPKEVRGFIILSAIIVGVVVVPAFIKLQMLQSNIVNLSEDDIARTDSIIAVLEENRVNQENSNHSKMPEIRLVKFNPNSVDKAEMQQLGFEGKVINNILKYRSKGGSFRVKSDLKKIYGVTEDFYLSLYPFIDLPEQPFLAVQNTSFQKVEKPDYKPYTASIKSFDINLADTVELIALKGIGEKLSKRIIAYRNKLGGFVNKNQFKEVYGLDSIALRSLEEYAMINFEFKPKRLNINRATIEELKVHPYMKYKTASIIVAYRKQHGNFNTLGDLTNIKAISEEDFNKLLPYLEL